ncbi:hypothetical protein KGM_203774 [Danaus plexippus plexippus]|uniref:Uncharacterized protein n=1 Tax=Danaus plexippus plexippus TaxID=278856 RepID=A0A212EK88_DANPL|nr:hypothetical protein KGM_203774 [Danaus plexippus plexippus]
MFLPELPRACMVDDVATYLQAPSSGQKPALRGRSVLVHGAYDLTDRGRAIQKRL